MSLERIYLNINNFNVRHKEVNTIFDYTRAFLPEGKLTETCFPLFKI